MKSLFEIGKTIIQRLKAHKFEAYFVGGAVRDYVMGRDIHDVDITTNAKPETIKKLFLKTIDVGVEHGTVIVLIEQIPFEVTTYRANTTEGIANGKNSVIFTPQLQNDLALRDFTMNAMAMTETYRIFDPFNGQYSIEQQLIHTVGEADKRFQEDALRMLRAIRFMSTLNFDIGENILTAITSHQILLKEVAIERIIEELRKMYHGTSLKVSKQTLEESGLIQAIPFFKECQHSLLTTIANDLTDELFLQTYLDPELAKFLSELKLSNNELNTIHRMKHLVDHLYQETYPAKVAFKYDGKIIRKLQSINVYNNILNDSCSSMLKEALNHQQYLPINNRQDLKVNGRTLMELFNLQGGPWIKALLSILEEKILLGELNNDQYELTEWMSTHVIIKDGHIKIVE